MVGKKKVLATLLSGSSDASIRFDQLRRLLLALEFEERIKGSHHIFTREGVPEILNLQPKGAKGKVYQVRQVRNVILKYQLARQADD